MKLQLLSFLLLPLLPLTSAFEAEQIVMGSHNQPFVPQTHVQPTLSDLLTIEPSASIFFSYAREIELSRMFDDSEMKITLLVPTNKAIMALARKPHQGPPPTTPDGEIGISEQDYDKQSKANVERWVSAHIIPESPISFEQTDYQTLLKGKSVSFKFTPRKDGKPPGWEHVTLEGGTHIIGMKQASNGVLYLIDKAIST